MASPFSSDYSSFKKPGSTLGGFSTQQTGTNSFLSSMNSQLGGNSAFGTSASKPSGSGLGSSSIFGTQQNQTGGFLSGNLGGGGIGSGTGVFSTGSSNFLQNQNSATQVSPGTQRGPFTPKKNAQFDVLAYNYQDEYKDYSLKMLRLQDYINFKSNNIYDVHKHNVAKYFADIKGNNQNQSQSTGIFGTTSQNNNMNFGLTSNSSTGGLTGTALGGNNIFGNSTGGSLLGSGQNNTGTGLFGQGPSTNSTASTNPFGMTTNSNPFSTGGTSQSIFKNNSLGGSSQSQTPQMNAFGLPINNGTQSQSSNNIFSGGTNTSIFGSTSNQQTSGTSNIFSNPSNPFGVGTKPFGDNGQTQNGNTMFGSGIPSATTTSPFGNTQNQQPANIFSNPTTGIFGSGTNNLTFGQTSQTSNNPFGQPTQSSNNPFGQSSFSPLGGGQQQQPSQNSFFQAPTLQGGYTPSAFGQKKPFGSGGTTFGSGLFGGASQQQQQQQQFQPQNQPLQGFVSQQEQLSNKIVNNANLKFLSNNNVTGNKTVPYCLLYLPIEPEKTEPPKKEEEKYVTREKRTRHPVDYEDSGHTRFYFGDDNRSQDENPLRRLEELNGTPFKTRKRYSPPTSATRFFYSSSRQGAVNYPEQKVIAPMSSRGTSRECSPYAMTPLRNNFKNHPQSRGSTSRDSSIGEFMKEPRLRKKSEEMIPASPQSSSLVKLNIQVVEGCIVEKAYPKSTLLAAVMKSIIEEYDVSRTGSETNSTTASKKGRRKDKWAFYLNGEELDLISEIKELNLASHDVIIFEKQFNDSAATSEVQSNASFSKNDGCTVFDFDQTGIPEEESEQEVNSEDRPADIKMIPTLNRQGYETEPSYFKICRMTEKELSKVPKFKVRNEWGEIHFFQPVDLRGVNLDDEINISRRMIDVYPNNSTKPAKGKGLNVAAQLTFYNFGLHSRKLSQAQIREKMAGWAESQFSQLINIDFEQDRIAIHVDHF